MSQICVNIYEIIFGLQPEIVNEGFKHYTDNFMLLTIHRPYLTNMTKFWNTQDWLSISSSESSCLRRIHFDNTCLSIFTFL